MPDNSDEEHFDNPTNSQSENPPAKIIPTAEIETKIPNQEIEKMEVHAHDLHKVPGQGWKHYIFEFLMLFLAVFAGFLAENQREHIVEHHREKKFARRLLSDLRQDSIFFETRIKLLEERQKAYKRFLKIMTNPAPAPDW